MKKRRKHSCYLKVRRTGPKSLLISIDRDVYCRKCGMIDKVRTRRQAIHSAHIHQSHMESIKRLKKVAKKYKKRDKKLKKLMKVT